MHSRGGPWPEMARPARHPSLLLGRGTAMGAHTGATTAI